MTSLSGQAASERERSFAMEEQDKLQKELNTVRADMASLSALAESTKGAKDQGPHQESTRLLRTFLLLQKRELLLLDKLGMWAMRSPALSKTSIPRRLSTYVIELPRRTRQSRVGTAARELARLNVQRFPMCMCMCPACGRFHVLQARRLAWRWGVGCVDGLSLPAAVQLQQLG